MKKTELTERNINLIKEIYHDSESFTMREVNEMLLEEFYCPTLEREMAEEGICSECGASAIEKQNIYDSEDDYGANYEYQCSECGHVIDIE